MSEPVSLAPGWPWKVSVMDELESHYLDEVIYREALGQRYRLEMGEREAEPGTVFLAPVVMFPPSSARP